jgi:hypothetical protein
MCRIVKCSERAFNDQINRELILFHAFRVIFDAGCVLPINCWRSMNRLVSAASTLTLQWFLYHATKAGFSEIGTAA